MKREQDSTNIATNAYPSQLQWERQELINKALDETRDNVKKAANEAKKDISTYAEQFTALQERAIDTARDIAEGYIELQREIFNSFNHFVWPTPYIKMLKIEQQLHFLKRFHCYYRRSRSSPVLTSEDL